MVSSRVVLVLVSVIATPARRPLPTDHPTTARPACPASAASPALPARGNGREVRLRTVRSVPLRPGQEHAVTDTLPDATIRNGVDTTTLFATIDAVKADPGLAAFRFR